MSVDVLSLIGILPNGQEFEIYENVEVTDYDGCIEYDDMCVFSAKVGYLMGRCNYLARNINYIRIVRNVVEIYLERVTQ